jgi:hypothetical protein
MEYFEVPFTLVGNEFALSIGPFRPVFQGQKLKQGTLAEGEGCITTVYYLLLTKQASFKSGYQALPYSKVFGTNRSGKSFKTPFDLFPRLA